MNHFTFRLTCNRCGGSLVHINGAHPSSLEAKAIVACVPCRAQFSVSVFVVDMRAELVAEGHERVRNRETARQLEMAS